MAEWASVSASQVETYLKCKRAWFNGSILKDRAPQTLSQIRGVEFHAEMEHYGKTGEVRPSSYLELVQVALTFLGEHSHVKDEYWKQFNGAAGLLLEQQIEMATYEGGPLWNGFIDRVIAMPDFGEVWDYKSTSDFRYAKTPEELKHSPQMVSYAKWLFLNSDYRQCLIKHLVVRMRGRAAAKPVEAILTREECEAEWIKILAIVREMSEWARLATTAEALPPNTEHCGAYGGCHYRPKCGFTNCIQTQRSVQMSDPSALMAKMLAAAGSAVGASSAPAAPVLPVAAPAPAPTVPVLPTPTPLAQPQTIFLPGFGPVVLTEATAAASSAPAPVAAQATPAPAAPAPAPAAPTPAPVAAQATPAPAAPTPAPAAPTPAPPSLLSLLGRAAPAAPAAPVLPTSTPAAAPAPAPVLPAPAVSALPTSILPPDASSRVSTPDEVGPPPAPPAAEPAQAAPTAAAPAPTPQPAVVPERKRGRPRKDAAATSPVVAPAVVTTTAPTETAPALTVTVSPTEAAPAPATIVPPLPPALEAAAQAAIASPPANVAPTPVPATGVVDLLAADKAFNCGCETLFVDCMPQKGWPGEQPVWLDSLMAAFTRTAAACAKQSDYALIRYESKGWLRTAIRVLMASLPKTVLVTTSTPGAAEFLEVITPYAKLIFRGI